jgi:MFS transporter, ACS family, hexuronate transporter
MRIKQYDQRERVDDQDLRRNDLLEGQQNVVLRLIAPDRYRWFVVLVMWAVHLVYFSTYASVGALGPLLKQDLGLSNTQFGILCGAIGVGTTSAQLPGGMWCDRIGVKRVLTLSFIGIGISAMVFSLTKSLAFGCSALFGLGLCVGCSQIAGTKAIVDWFPSDGRATAMGLKQTGGNVGGALASLILPVAAVFYGWQSLYQSMGAFVCGAAVLFALAYRDAGGSSKKSVVVEVSFGTRLLALKNPRFLLITVIGIFLIGVQFSFSSYIVLYLSQYLHMPLPLAGSILAVSFAAGAAGRVGWGVAGDYLFKNRETSLVVLGVLGLLVCVALAFLTSSTPIWLLYTVAVLSGVSLLGWNGVWLSLVGEVSLAYSTGFAIGLCFLFANLGLLLGPPLFGFLGDLFHSFVVSWLFLAACMAGISFAMALEARRLAVMRKDEVSRMC